MEWKVGSLASIMLSIIWEDKAFCRNNSKAHVQIVTWQQINMTESTDSTQKSAMHSRIRKSLATSSYTQQKGSRS